ncbi:MAG: septal ring lytic transglycosylase RlpA family protein [Polyangiaceae bacterium]
MKSGFCLGIVALACTAGCGSSAQRNVSPGPNYGDPSSGSWTAWHETGIASYYASSLAGRKTASGERYDPHQLTAAHRRLPFGTLVEVRRRDGKRSVIVRINDRGPWVGNRVIDLSLRAAQALEMVPAGKATVDIHPYAGPGTTLPPRRPLR